jgi:hypothetical protein
VSLDVETAIARAEIGCTLWVTGFTRRLSLQREHHRFVKIKFNNADAAARAVQVIVSSGESLQENPRRAAIVDEIAGLRKTHT